MKESDIQSGIIDYLKSKGFKVIKTKVNTRSGEADLIVCMEGKYVEIEVKVPGGKPTELQTRKLMETHRAGGIAFYATSVDDVRQTLYEGRKDLLVQSWYNTKFKKFIDL